MYKDQFGAFVGGYWGLKETSSDIWHLQSVALSPVVQNQTLQATDSPFCVYLFSPRTDEPLMLPLLKAGFDRVCSFRHHVCKWKRKQTKQ